MGIQNYGIYSGKSVRRELKNYGNFGWKKKIKKKIPLKHPQKITTFDFNN